MDGQTRALRSHHLLLAVAAREACYVRERLFQRAGPRVISIRNPVGRADRPHFGGDFPEPIRRELWEEMVLDLTVERTAENRDGVRHLEVVRGRGLHRVPLAASLSARTFRVRGDISADVAA